MPAAYGVIEPCDTAWHTGKGTLAAYDVIPVC